MPSLGGWEFVILIGILVLLFGAKRLPDMARSIGQSARVFKGEMKGLKDDGPAKDAPTQPQAPAGQIPPAVPVVPAEPVAQPVTQPVTQPVAQPQEAGRAGQSPNGTGL